MPYRCERTRGLLSSRPTTLVSPRCFHGDVAHIDGAHLRLYSTQLAIVGPIHGMGGRPCRQQNQLNSYGNTGATTGIHVRGGKFLSRRPQAELGRPIPGEAPGARSASRRPPGSELTGTRTRYSNVNSAGIRAGKWGISPPRRESESPLNRSLIRRYIDPRVVGFRWSTTIRLGIKSVDRRRGEGVKLPSGRAWWSAQAQDPNQLLCCGIPHEMKGRWE